MENGARALQPVLVVSVDAVCVCVRCMRSCGSANAHQGRNLHMACATMSANATTVSRKHVDHGMAARTLHMTLARRSDNAIRDARIDDLHFVQSVGAETRFFVRLFYGRLVLGDFFCQIFGPWT